jgi:hypothetical protein
MTGEAGYAIPKPFGLLPELDALLDALREARQLGPDLAGHTESGDQIVYVSGGELGLRRERINDQFVTRG